MGEGESQSDPTTPMEQPHKTNGITRRGCKTLRAFFLEADQMRILISLIQPSIGCKHRNCSESIILKINVHEHARKCARKNKT
jgi:hypothetical protein